MLFRSPVAIPRRQPISPSPPSHGSPNADKPSPPSHRRSKLHCRPKLHWHRLRYETNQGRNEAEEFGFGGVARFMGFFGFRGGGLARFHGGWVSWVSGGVAVLVVICVVVFG